MSIPRQDTRVIAPIAMMLEIAGQSQACFTRNISRGGLFVVTQMRAPQGATVKVSLTHQKKRLTVHAKIAAIREDGMGLRFIDKTDEFKSGINKLINTLLTAKGGVVAARAVSKTVQAGAAWAYPLGDQDTETWQRTIKPVALKGLSLDGAALAGKSRPDIGDLILFFITTPDDPSKAHHCNAAVARHLESGFAIKFIKPSVEFRRTITNLRRGGAGD